VEAGLPEGYRIHMNDCNVAHNPDVARECNHLLTQPKSFNIAQKITSTTSIKTNIHEHEKHRLFWNGTPKPTTFTVPSQINGAHLKHFASSKASPSKGSWSSIMALTRSFWASSERSTLVHS